MSPRRVSRIVLVGFMGAGKSSVGRALARELGWRFVDADTAVEERAGMPVPEIFRRHGEARFRALEAEAMDALLEERNVVVAAGGGWATADEGRLAGLPAESLSIWLDVGAEEAVRRAEEEPGRRPLLAVEEPVARARELLGARERAYAAASLRVDTDGRTVDDVTARIRRMLAEPGIEIDAP